MTTLNGVMPLQPGEELACAWCGLPTDVRFVPPAHPELGPLPLNILCAGALILAYERMLRGEILSPQDRGRMQRLAAHGAASSPRLAATAYSSSSTPGTTKPSGR